MAWGLGSRHGSQQRWPGARRPPMSRFRISSRKASRGTARVNGAVSTVRGEKASEAVACPFQQRRCHRGAGLVDHSDDTFEPKPVQKIVQPIGSVGGADPFKEGADHLMPATE